MTTQLIYGALTDWYRLIDPPADHADEAASYQAALEQAVSGSATTLLELGCGGGHNLLAAARTAFEHTRPGGAAVFAPDMFREGFCDQAELMEADGDGRSLRGVSWQWDPDPADSTYLVDYAFLLRDASGVRSVHDRHVEGLFAQATWPRILAQAGWQVGTFARPLDTPGTFDEVFVCTRPG